jgi:hypothetical protein
VNEKIMELNRLFKGRTVIACECSDASCSKRLRISPRAYEAVRRRPRRFVVIPDHVDPDGERLVAGADEYAVVEVFAAIAAADMNVVQIAEVS